VERVAVRTVQFDHVESQAQAAFDCRQEGLLDSREPDCIERHGRVPSGSRIEGQRGRRDGRPGKVGCIGLRQRPSPFPRPLRRGLAPGMSELNAELHIGHPAADPLDDRLQSRFVLVAVDAEAALRDAALTLDMGRFEAEQPRARHRQHAVVNLVPRLGTTVDRRVLAHRRHDDPVGQGDTAQIDRCEKLGHGYSPERCVSR
jgi:hypothetical protein